MRMLRLGAVFLGGALGAALFASGLAAQEQTAETYPATLRFGTGLITIPVAWVSPRSGDIWITSSATSIPATTGTWKVTDGVNWNTNGAIETDWFGRVSLGVALYSQNPEWGVFGRALVVDERDLREHRGLGWLPSIAVGVRNVGPYEHEDRLLVGHTLQRDAAGRYVHAVQPFALRFQSTPTMYAVATKSFHLGTANASLTAGYGDGIFRDDGGLGTNYNDKGQLVAGLFFGGRIAVHPFAHTTLTLLGENSGWDWNAGAVGGWRGLSLGVYGTELEEGRGSAAKGALYHLYNYAKISVALGVTTNLFDLSEGALLRSRMGQLEHEQVVLRGEVVEREQRLASLLQMLSSARTGELPDVSKRRRELEAQIQAERDAIRRAQDRLQKIQDGQEQKASLVGVAMPESH